MQQPTFEHFPQYLTFGIISAAALLLAIALAVVLHFRQKKSKIELTTIHILTIGVAVAGFFLFVPIYFFNYDFGDSTHPVRSVLLSLHNTFRIFILDGEFDIVRNAVEPAKPWFRRAFSVYASILYVLAPCLTFTNLLSLFQNLWDEIRFTFACLRPIYIFSELSDASLAMAESLVQRYEHQAAERNAAKKQHIPYVGQKPHRPILVFTDVFIQEDEEGYELRLKARDLKAICLKRDITRVNVRRKPCRVEFFLLGENESENMEQAIKLTQENKETRGRAIFLYTMYANHQTAAYILDSIDKGEVTLHPQLCANVKKNPLAFLKNPDANLPDEVFDSNFYVRRIDNVGELARQILTSNEIVQMIRDCPDHTISLVIMGMGSYGKALLQNALWLYQIWGYNLEITVFDSRQGDGKDILQVLRKDWPEIVCDDSGHYVCNADGDCHYDLQFFTNIDCFGYQFEQLFEVGSPYRQRLQRTNAAFVALGNDDHNIEASVMLRSMFDRINHVQSAELGGDGARLVASNDPPLLYAIVYDDRKAANLTSQNEVGGTSAPSHHAKGLVNHKEQPLHINFVGNLSSQYAYDVIENIKAIECTALRYHTEWIWNMCLDNNNLLDIGKAIRSGKKLPKYDKNGNQMYYESGPRKGEPIDQVQELIDTIIDALNGYTRFEYFRNASIARSIHKDMLCRLYQIDIRDEGDEVTCESGQIQKQIEHARWNAYMRVHGYRLPDMVGTGGNHYNLGSMKPYRNDRGLLHYELVPWDLLPESERQKDALRRRNEAALVAQDEQMDASTDCETDAQTPQSTDGSVQQ